LGLGLRGRAWVRVRVSYTFSRYLAQRLSGWSALTLSTNWLGAERRGALGAREGVRRRVGGIVDMQVRGVRTSVGVGWGGGGGGIMSSLGTEGR